MAGFGWIKDEFDIRDRGADKLLRAAVPLPSKFITNTAIYNQYQTPSCVAASLAGIKTNQEYKESQRVYKFDFMALYRECKKIDGIPNEEGTYPRVALRYAQEYGMKLENSFWDSFWGGKQQWNTKWKIDSYYRIDRQGDNDIELIKQILVQYGDIMTSSYWYTSWSGKFSIFPDPAGRSGGHAYRVIGYNDEGKVKGLYIANSWGKWMWGDSGVALMPYNMFLTYVLPEGDTWKVIDSKQV